MSDLRKMCSDDWISIQPFHLPQRVQTAGPGEQHAGDSSSKTCPRTHPLQSQRSPRRRRTTGGLRVSFVSLVCVVFLKTDLRMFLNSLYIIPVLWVPSCRKALQAWRQGRGLQPTVALTSEMKEGEGMAEGADCP